MARANGALLGTRSYRGDVQRLLQTVRGAALGGLIAGGILAVVLIVGFGPRNMLIYAAVALAGFVFVLIPDENARAAGMGSLAVTALGAVPAIVTGPGVVEVALALGGIGAFVWLRFGGVGSRSIRVGLVSGVVIAVVAAALVPLVANGETLGHDESAYALKAVAWLEGAPDTGWTIHRGPALSGFAYFVLGADGSEAALRTVGLVSLIGLALATWRLGWRMFAGSVGAFAALVVVAGPAILRRSTEFLTDIPAAALLMVCMVVLWREFADKAQPSYALAWLLPFAWGAFYLRYQSILALGLIGLTVLILFWSKVRARPGPLVATASIGAVGLIPHFAYSIQTTGSPIGILLFTGRVAGREFLGEGIIDYALLSVWPLMGLVGIPAIVLFLIWVINSWSEPTRRKKALFLAVPAIGQVLALGIVSHGEARFVFFPMALTAVGAVAGVAHWLSLRDSRIRSATAVGLVALLFGSIALSVDSARSSVDRRINSNEPVELSAELIEAESGRQSCAVMTSYTPQVTFYSGCWTGRFRVGLDPAEAVEALEGDARWMMLIDNGKRQPTGSDLAGLVDEADSGPVVVDGEFRDALVFRMD